MRLDHLLSKESIPLGSQGFRSVSSLDTQLMHSSGVRFSRSPLALESLVPVLSSVVKVRRDPLRGPLARGLL